MFHLKKESVKNKIVVLVNEPDDFLKQTSPNTSE